MRRRLCAARLAAPPAPMPLLHLTQHAIGRGKHALLHGRKIVATSAGSSATVLGGRNKEAVHSLEPVGLHSSKLSCHTRAWCKLEATLLSSIKWRRVALGRVEPRVPTVPTASTAALKSTAGHTPGSCSTCKSQPLADLSHTKKPQPTPTEPKPQLTGNGQLLALGL